MNPKAGWKTTEFWFQLAAVVVAYLLTTDMGSDPTTIVAKLLVAISTILAAFGFTVARTVIKRNPAPKAKK